MSFIPATASPESFSWSPSRHEPRAEPADQVSIGLLRHSTKNALQRILCELERATDLRDLRGGRRLLVELERRVRLSATLSDALFGLTRPPGAMADRLRAVCETTLELMSDGDQMIGLDVTTEGEAPAAQRHTLLRAAHEMVGNAVKHGLHARLLGHVTVRLTSDAAGTTLIVEDNGWGFAGATDDGQGLGLLRSLADLHGGTVEMRRIAMGSRARLHLPGDGHR